MPSPETVSKKAPTWRIGTSTRDDREKAMQRQTRPPPGQHDPKFNSVAESAAVWSFGTSQRPAPYPSKKTPGAGAYDPPSKIVEGPQFHMGLKLDN